MSNNHPIDELLSRNPAFANSQPLSADRADQNESQLELWTDLLDIWNFNGQILIY